MAPQQRDIGRFKGATMIGRGGFGAVYAADDPEHGRQVAIKILSGELGERERRRFDRERQTMGRLGSHPNIIPVHDSGYTEDGEGYIVMELAQAGSLRGRVDDQGPLGWEEATDVAIAIAGAAQAAHDVGVLHRDIKPDNILIDAYGNPRLTDFGIAAVASNATATTSTTATLAHAAPELLNGDTSTEAVDIYAIGSSFYNLVLGHPPFLSDDQVGVTAMVGRALTQPPPDLRPRGVPHAIAAVIEKSMAKEPGERQSTAAQLAEELRAAKANPGAATMMAPLPDTPSPSQTVVAGGPIGSPEQLIAQGLAQAPAQTPPNQAHIPTGQVPGAASPGAVPPPGAAPGVGATGATATGHGVPPHLQTYQQPTQAGTAPLAGGQFPQQTVGDQPPVAPGAHGQFVPGDGGRNNRTPLLLALGVLAIGIVGVIAVLALGSNDDTATTPTTDDTAETTETTDGDTSEITDPDETTASSTETTTTTSAETTASSTETTVATTLPPDTAPVDVDCPILVVEGQTARFDVRICTDGAGTTTYQGLRRDTGDGITLNACFSGFGYFVAENEGFLYEVDTEAAVLWVVDPDGDIIVSEDIIAPFFVDLTTPYTVC